MRKIITSILIFSIIFSLTGCGEKKKDENIQIVTNTKKEQYLYSHDIVSLHESNIDVANPFPDDILLDRYGNKLYYFNATLGLYTTDLIGTKKDIMLTFEGKNYVVFSTENRINAIQKDGSYMQNLITRDDEDKIELLFITDDWIYYKVISPLNTERYFKINLSGTCKELKQNPVTDLRIKNRVEGNYFFPELLDYTHVRNTRYRSRINNFYITFPDSWRGNFIIEEEKGIFIVYFKPRLDENIKYEFFRIIREDIPSASLLVPINNANEYLLLPNGTYKIGRYSHALNFDNESFDGVLINRMIKDIPDIIYSITR